jgi:ABC-type Mn2+/Zn2+ transport system permease subunit
MPEGSASLGWLVAEPLSFPFMQRALIATLAVAVACAVVGSFVLARGLAYLGDALAHSAFAGIALALLLRRNIYLGATGAAILTSVAVSMVARRGGVSATTASGVLFAGAFALGIALISPARNYTVDLFSYIFGNVLGIGPEDLAVILPLCGLVLVVVGLTHRALLYAAFDPRSAEADGLPVTALHYLLLGLMTLTVVAAVKTLGIVLVVAMLVTPGATAAMLTTRFSRAVLLAAGLAALAAVLGLYVSFYANVPSGASTVLVSTGLFLATLLAVGPGRAAASAS